MFISQITTVRFHFQVNRNLECFALTTCTNPYLDNLDLGKLIQEVVLVSKINKHRNVVVTFLQLVNFIVFCLTYSQH